MFRSYLTTALRHLRGAPGFTLINVLGLAVGMACCLLIGLYVQDELRYDTFHANADRIAVTTFESGFFGRTLSTPPAVGEVLREDVSQVQTMVRAYAPIRPVAVVRGGADIEASDAPTAALMLADSTFLDVFDFTVRRGDADALHMPNAAMLTESTARLLFGEDDPLGQSIEARVRGAATTLTVRAVVADPPQQSTLQFDVLAPLRLLPEEERSATNWGQLQYKTYALLRPEASLADFERAMKRAIAARTEEDASTEERSFSALALPSVYLSDLYTVDGFRGQRQYVRLFGAVAVFVLLIAVINYVNLVTVQATKRVQEVGMRKALGAGRGQLALQFLGESVLVSAGALAVAWGVTATALPAFNALFGKSLSLQWSQHALLISGLSVGVLGVGALSGIYPALVLSRFQPVRILRGHSSTERRSSRWLHRGLVVAQFAISTALLGCTAIVYNQLQYMQEKNLGFDSEQVVSVSLPTEAWSVRDALTSDLETAGSITSVSTATAAPSQFGMRLGISPESLSPEAAVETDGFLSFVPARVDPSYTETLGLTVIAGRDFSEADAERGQPVYMLNQTAVESLGWTPREAIGKPFAMREGEGTVIGVVEDFHTGSLRRTIPAVSLQLHEPSSWSSSPYLIVRLTPGGIRAGMDRIEAQLAEVVPNAGFDYTFLDDAFGTMYRAERQLGRVFILFAGIAVFVACLGLFGLATYTAERRTQEIGIRKAMGATAGSIVRLLTQEFAVLVGIALLIAAPAAYLAMDSWLADFAYRTTPGPLLFAAVGSMAFVLALGTVGVQAWRAARLDPTKALRSE